MTDARAHRRAPATAGALRVALVTAAVVATGCAGSSGDGAPEATSVGDVSLEVPPGWERADEDAASPLLVSARFSDPDATLRTVQVVVGCDPAGVDALVDGVVGTPRGPLVVTAADEHLTAWDVPGADRARRVDLTLGAGRADDATTLRTAALYAEAGDALVLVEVTTPPAAADPARADEVLRSVTLDEALPGRC